MSIKLTTSKKEETAEEAEAIARALLVLLTCTVLFINISTRNPMKKKQLLQESDSARVLSPRWLCNDSWVTLFKI